MVLLHAGYFMSVPFGCRDTEWRCTASYFDCLHDTQAKRPSAGTHNMRVLVILAVQPLRELLASRSMPRARCGRHLTGRTVHAHKLYNTFHTMPALDYVHGSVHWTHLRQLQWHVFVEPQDTGMPASSHAGVFSVHDKHLRCFSLTGGTVSESTLPSEP